jgi:hypothetical protein
VTGKATIEPTHRTFATFEEFWPYYLRQHADPRTRALHFVGTTVAFWLIVGATLSGRPSLLFAAVPAAYVFAWAGHSLVERNRPATFGSPLWSLRGDIRMYRLWLDGRVARELFRSGVS